MAGDLRKGPHKYDICQMITSSVEYKLKGKAKFYIFKTFSTQCMLLMEPYVLSVYMPVYS